MIEARRCVRGSHPGSTRSWPRLLAAAAMGAWLAGCGLTAKGQQVLVEAPLQTASESFSENFGVGWSLSRLRPNGSGWFFNNGGINGMGLPFGGGDPNAAARFGVGGRIGGTNFRFGLTGGQSSSRTFGAQSASVMVPNGGSGFFASGSLRPFVTGVIPVVGARAVSPLELSLQQLQQLSPAQRADRLKPRAEAPAPEATAQAATASLRLGPSRETDAGSVAAPSASTAERGDLSLAEIRRARQAELAQQDRALAELVDKARGAEQSGKRTTARIYYEQAARRAQGDAKRELEEKIRALRQAVR